MKEAFEEWRDVAGYEGYYQVSNKGNVRSVDREIECNGGIRLQKGKQLKPFVNKQGYRQVILNKKGMKLFRINRLVAQAFVPNPEGLPIVNHKDEDKGNDNAENLEWCTYLYNLTYNELHHRRNNKNRSNSIAVVKIKDGLVIDTYPSTREAARSVNGNSGNISQCCRGLKNSAYGFQWEYAIGEWKDEKRI